MKNKNEKNKGAKKQKEKQKKSPLAICIAVTSVIALSMSALALSRLADVSKMPEPQVILSAPQRETPIFTETLSESVANLPKEQSNAEEAENAAVEETVTAGAKPTEIQLLLPVDKSELLVPYATDNLLKSKTMGDWRVHSGVDMQADSGSEVKAAAAGTVTGAYFDPQMGHTVEITHEGGYKTVYQNLASTEMVQEGMAVAAGQCVAAVGNSAAAELLEDSHLHFALIIGETFADPMEFVK